ncbi:MAG: hypothetical protein HYY24_10270 [Verrucomicrobia bacterium]|nr:hypothetical protein [Verrucomicrobiota bacterium]
MTHHRPTTVTLLTLVTSWLLCTAQAQDRTADPTGTWKWSFTTQNGDTINASVKLKSEGGKLTGAFTGRDGAESPVQDAALTGSELSFKVTRERDGQRRTTTYKGKITGDTIKGTMTFVRDGEERGRDWEAKREPGTAQGAAASASGAAQFAGTWTWTFTPPNGQAIDLRLKLKQDGDKLGGVLIRNENERPISDPQVKGEELSFKVIRERDGRTVTAKYNGTLSGDTIKGKMESDYSGQPQTFDWEAKREKAAVASAAGTWQWTLSFQGQDIEVTLKLQQDGEKLTGVSSVGGGNEANIEDGWLRGGEISYTVTRERDGQKLTAKYKGKLEGDKITGKLTSNFSGEERTLDWNAKRVKP